MDSPEVPDFLAGIDMDSLPTLEDAMDSDEQVDLKALLLRRFAWDTQRCSDVLELIPKLGLALSTDEGIEREHGESHHRMAAVLPFEGPLRDYALILGTVLTTAITEAQGVSNSMSPEQIIGFARQNAELILAGGRAMLAQLFFMGLVGYGPAIEIRSAHYDESGNLVFDTEAPLVPDDDEVPGQLSFDDVERDR